MKICVTGATGFIGVNLTLRLAEAGHTVHALCRSESKAALIRHENVKVFMGDILNEEALSKAIDSCDIIFHLAAYAKPWSKDHAVYYDINVGGTKLVLDIAEKLSVKKVIITSTAGIFGPSLNGNLISEKSSPSISFLTEYDRTKALADELVKAYSGSGIEIIRVHPTRVYGPGLLNESNSLTIIIQKFINGKWHIIPSDGESKGSYVFIDDVVQGHILAMEKGKTGERYILGGDNVSFNEFFNTLCNVSGKSARLYHLPYFMMMTVGKMMVFIASLTGITPMITPGFIKRYHYNWAFSSAKAIDELGYHITPLEDGMKRTMEWLNTKI